MAGVAGADQQRHGRVLCLDGQAQPERLLLLLVAVVPREVVRLGSGEGFLRQGGQGRPVRQRLLLLSQVVVVMEGVGIGEWCLRGVVAELGWGTTQVVYARAGARVWREGMRRTRK